MVSNFSLLQDEDFVASENGSIDDSDGEASDSDELSEEGSDAENEDDGDDPALPDLPAELQATLRQALEGEKVLDEPILSDSEISREFPEEEDDIFGALAGSDFDSEGDEDATSGATGSEGSAHDVRRAASTITAAQSAAAAVAVTERGGRAAAAAMRLSPTATTTMGHRSRTRFGEEARSEQALPSPQLVSLSVPQGDRPTSPPMEVFGAMLPSLEDNHDGATSRPIARRTRANVSLMDVTIEELEDQLAPATGLNEPLLYFGVDDAAEWERFIAGLQTSINDGVIATGANGGASMLGGAGVLDTYGDNNAGNTDMIFNNDVGTAARTGINTEFEDSDDEDFVVELERMLREDEAMRLHHGFDTDLGISLPDDFFNYNHGGGGGGGKHHGNFLRGNGGPHTRSGRRSRKRRRVEKPPRRSARLLGTTKAERPRYMASLMDRRTGKATAAALQQGIFDVHPSLQQAYDSTIGAPAPLSNGLDELATLAAALATGPPIPLPSEMAKPGTAAAAKTVVWKAPLPKAMRKYDLSAQPDESAPIVGAHFQSSQYSDLYLSIHYHVQLLAQTTIMAAATNDIESAKAGAQLLREMEEFVANQTNLRRDGGIPAYVSSCLGIDTGEGLGEEENGPSGTGFGGGSGGGIDYEASGSRPIVGQYSNNRRWTPQNPGNIYTIADVSVLRAAPRMLELLPSIIGGGGGGGTTPAEAITTVGREDPVSSPELENRQPAGPSTVAEENKRKRKRGKQTNQHPIWSDLSADIARALVPVRPFFNPEIEPMAPNFNVTSQMLFTPAEDELLAWGIRKHLYEWPKIAAELLPAKDEKMIFNRKKNRCKSVAPDNIVKEVVSLSTGNLTLAEELLIVQALVFYGKQAKKWEMICKEHLPHRHPKVLSMLWSERQKKICAAATAGAGTGGHVVMDIATVTAAAAAMPRANQGLVMVDEGAAAAAKYYAEADHMLAEMVAQEQYAMTRQLEAAAIGAGFLLPPPNASIAGGAAAAAMPPLPHPSEWAGIPQGAAPDPMQQQKLQQQQLSAGGAGAATRLALPRLVEWEQQPGEVEVVPEQQQQPRQVPPRNAASQLHDMLTARAADGEAAATAAVWSAEDDKAVLRSALANGGALREEQLEELENTLGRSKEDLLARSKVLVERFLEKAKQERERRQATNGGDGSV